MDWIQNLQQNREKALKQLYNLHRLDCINFLLNNFKLEQEDAKDVFQISIIILYENIIDGKLTLLTSNIRTYLFGIIKNQALVFLKQKNSINNVNKLGIILQVSLDENQDQLDYEILINKLETSLNQLGSPCNKILEYYYIENYSMEKITNIFDYKNAETTKNLKYKCLKRLQKIYLNYKS